MSISFENIKNYAPKTGFISSAVDLLNQQIWYWGRDICKEEGNLLVEIGFERIEPPLDSDALSSVYSIELPTNRNIILRGYGIFYGCSGYGGIFLPRREFLPGYITDSKLQYPPWLETDLPEFRFPLENELQDYTFLLVELIEWIQHYEQNILENHGLEYRLSVLTRWDNGKRRINKTEDVVMEWQSRKDTIQDGVFISNRNMKDVIDKVDLLQSQNKS